LTHNVYAVARQKEETKTNKINASAHLVLYRLKICESSPNGTRKEDYCEKDLHIYVKLPIDTELERQLSQTDCVSGGAVDFV